MSSRSEEEDDDLPLFPAHRAGRPGWCRVCDLSSDHFVAFADPTLMTPSMARRFVDAHACPAHGRFVKGALALVTSELVTNAVRHGRPPVTVQLSCLGQEARLAVSDTGPWLPDGQGTSGRLGLGLRIVAKIASDWGTTDLGSCKEVWCLVPTGMPVPTTKREPVVLGGRP